MTHCPADYSRAAQRIRTGRRRSSRLATAAIVSGLALHLNSSFQLDRPARAGRPSAFAGAVQLQCVFGKHLLRIRDKAAAHSPICQKDCSLPGVRRRRQHQIAEIFQFLRIESNGVKNTRDMKGGVTKSWRRDVHYDRRPT